MDPVISSEAIAMILRAAVASPDREVCGLLLRRPGAPIEAVACANVAADPATRFEIDPAALLAAHRAARGGGPAVVGHYHSHPSGRPVPSPRDAADAVEDGILWLIVADGAARLWRSVPDGAVEGRFDPVALTPAIRQKGGIRKKDEHDGQPS